MSRKSGHRFSEKDMRKRKNLERIPIQLKRDALRRRGMPWMTTRHPEADARSGFAPIRWPCPEILLSEGTPYQANVYGVRSQNDSAADDTPPVTTQGSPSSTWPVAAAAMQPTASAPWPSWPHQLTLRL
jgi:hypothetical protein